MRRIEILILVVLLSAGTAISFQQRPLESESVVWTGGNATAAGNWIIRRSVHAVTKFDCLPKDVQKDEVVSYGRNGKQNVTVEKKLIELKARCRNGKLVDTKNKEIRFFRVSCWGNPPSDYLEIQKRESKELEKLKKRYTVILMTCDPRTM